MRALALLAFSAVLTACGADTGASAPAESVPSLTPARSAIDLICAPPAYDECATDMETFLDGWTADNLRGQILGVCDLGSGKGDVVWIDTEAEAQAECEAAQEFRDPGALVDVVRVVTLP